MKAVIFDMDGVLIDSETYWDSLLPDFLRRRIPDFADESMVSVQGLSNHGLYEWLCQKHALSLAKEEFLEWLLEFADEIYERHVQLMPGCQTLLDELYTQNIPVALASSSPQQSIQTVMRRFSLYPRIHFQLSADDVGGRGKPHPDVFLKAAERLRVQPSDCLVLEDSTHGIEAALRAGMHVLALQTEQNMHQSVSRAHKVFSSYSSSLRSYIMKRLNSGNTACETDNQN